MSTLLRYVLVLGFCFAALAGLTWIGLPHLTDRKTNGELELAVLDAPARVVRDAAGVPYIYAESLDDALRVQGFVMGQDRLFQLEAARRAASGRLAEVFGAGSDDVILNLDREARTIGFYRLAEQQLDVLSASARRQLSVFLEGLNAYVATRSDTHPLEFALAGIVPEPWTEAQLLAIAFYMGWGSAANFDAELVAHEVIQAIGPDAFAEIAPLTINPDDNQTLATQAELPVGTIAQTAHLSDWTHKGWRQMGVGGSNNWAISGAKAVATAAIVTNDPHLDSRTLPGPWHPVGIFTPELRALGVSIGLPGITTGRNEHIAFGVTNAYADAIDLYVETLDPQNPNHYLEGEVSLPFRVITERLRIKDSDAESGFREEVLEIRFTNRGPVITDHDPDAGHGAVLSMRWAAAEFMGDELGVDALMRATSVDEALAAVEHIRFVSLNFVVGDTHGRIGRRASGAAPIRLRGNGMAPFAVTDGVDNWGGRIPAGEMPGEVDPARGWTGTANHMTAPADYPWVYTSYASPNYRYRRIGELLAAPQVSAEDVWAAQYDDLNLFARDIAPILAQALQSADDTDLVEVGDVLASWNHHDDERLRAPTLFQELIRQLAQATFEDELGEEATAAYLSNWYVWQQRFDAMLQSGESPWFDDRRTDVIEDLPTLIRRAGVAALERLTKVYGADRASWRWGEVHRIHFTAPLRQSGWIGRLTGNRSVAMSGSGETLLRALYTPDDPFNTKWFASLRMTADLNDPDKVRAVLPGGVVGRTFNAHLNDQTQLWQREDSISHWWFSDEAIAAHAQHTLRLLPEVD